MTKIEVETALQAFHDKMKDYSLYTMPPLKIYDGISYGFKYFDKNDEAVACFSYVELPDSDQPILVELYFGEFNECQLTDLEPLMALINLL